MGGHTEEEIESAIEFAMASVRLDRPGWTPPPELIEDVYAVERGEITADEAFQRVLARYGLA